MNLQKTMKEKPKIAVVGYGSMGREVEKAAKEQDITVTNIFDIDSMIDTAKTYEFDIAIEFTHPDEVIENVRLLAGMGKSVVTGTTGWYGEKELMFSIIRNAGTGLVFGTNFSVGMQMFFRLTRFAAALMNRSDSYDIMLHEMHHHRKKDSPSGSAKKLADIILNEVDKKKHIFDDTAREKIHQEALHVSSTRGGEIFGRHTVYIDSLADTIELTHNAKNRKGFALGALEAAKWLHGKKGIYDFGEIFEDIWTQS